MRLRCCSRSSLIARVIGIRSLLAGEVGTRDGAVKAGPEREASSEWFKFSGEAASSGTTTLAQERSCQVRQQRMACR